MLKSVASVDDHESVTVAPGFTVVGDALIVTVGCAEGATGAVCAGGVELTFLLHPSATAKIASSETISTDF
jgi:hypothetical protein